MSGRDGVGEGMDAVPVDDPERLAEVMRAVKCLLLDFDGPVCSVFAGYPAPHVAEEMRTALLAEEIPLTETGRTTSDPMVVLSDAASQSPDGQRLAEELLQETELTCVQTARPTPGAHELIRIAHAHDLKIVIVSNNGTTAIRAYLNLHGLTGSVFAVFGRDPNDASLMKPHPHLLWQALELTGCPATQSVFVGDSISDVAAGVAAGVAVIGFANKPNKRHSLIRTGAIAIVGELASIQDVIR
jgi:beta-phosphoglucomutase-like phosphatase (HAD superfamily)